MDAKKSFACATRLIAATFALGAGLSASADMRMGASYEPAREPYARGKVQHCYGLGVTTLIWTNLSAGYPNVDVYGLHLNPLEYTMFGTLPYRRVYGMDLSAFHILLVIPWIGGSVSEMYGIQAGILAMAVERYGIGVAPLLDSKKSRGIDLGFVTSSLDFQGLSVGAFTINHNYTDGGFVAEVGLFNWLEEIMGADVGIQIGVYNNLKVYKPMGLHLQIGVVNMAKSLPEEGCLFQFGLANCCCDTCGCVVQLGAVNINETRSHEISILPFVNFLF